MDYEWDDAKSEATRKDRGFGFEIVEGFEWNYALGPDIQYVDGEEREVWIGPIGTKLHVLVVTKRENRTRVISLRIAEKPDIGRWRDEFQNA